MRAELRSDRRIKLFYQGVGVHPWILDRRNGLAQGTYNRLMEDDRPSGEQILREVQWRLNTLISRGVYPAYQMVFGSIPVDLFGWEDGDKDLTFAQDASPSGHLRISGNCA